jgi:hypothetical protein
MVASHNPSTAIRLARTKLVRRDDLESALLMLVQVFGGTPPQDLEVDSDAARAFASLLEAFVPAVSVDPEAIRDMFAEDKQFGTYLAQLTELDSLSLEDWKQARDDALLLRTKRVFPPIDSSVESGQWFAMSFGLVLTAISLKRIDPLQWEEILTKVREVQPELLDGPIPSHLQHEEVMTNGA